MNRPTGITILSVLYTFGGLLTLVLLVAMSKRLTEGVQQIGFSGTEVHIALGFLGVLGIAGGVGMFRGKKWGWWLGAFYLSYSVARSANAIFVLSSVVEQYSVPAERAALQYLKYGGRVIVHSLICWYFFSDTVSAYFDFPFGSKARRLGLLILSTVAVFVVMGGIGWMLR